MECEGATSRIICKMEQKYTKSELLLRNYAHLRKLIKSNRIVPIRNGDDFLFYAMGLSREIPPAPGWDTVSIDNGSYCYANRKNLRACYRRRYIKFFNALTAEELIQEYEYWRGLYNFSLIQLTLKPDNFTRLDIWKNGRKVKERINL